MARVRLVLAMLVVGVLMAAMATTACAQAQDGGGNGGGRNGGGRFDPAQMRQRAMDRFKEQLGATDQEWTALQPRIEKLMAAQRDARAGGMMGMMGARGGFGGRGGNRNGGDQAAETPVAKAAQELSTTLENKDASADQILQKLTAYREAREKARQDLAAAQKELKELLTQRQEAVLVMMGMLE